MKNSQRRYWLNDKSEFHWEIVGPDGLVCNTLEKTSDDDNRVDAEKMVEQLNLAAASAAGKGKR